MSQINDIPHVIQVSVAPVFLLTSVAGALSVFTTRLARIVDRARELDRIGVATRDEAELDRVHDDLAVLSHRARLVNISITLAVLCAMFVCGVITLLFADAVLEMNSALAIALCFVLAMVCFFAALACFLRETYLATSSMRFAQRP